MFGSRPRSIAIAAPRTPGGWRTIKRDWQRWSRAERIAAECILFGFMLSAAFLLTTISLP